MTPSKILQAVLGAIVAAGFFVVLYVLLRQAIPAENRDVVNLMIGALIGAFTTLMGFAFGSSFSSQRKDELNAARPLIVGTRQQ